MLHLVFNEFVIRKALKQKVCRHQLYVFIKKKTKFENITADHDREVLGVEPFKKANMTHTMLMMGEWVFYGQDYKKYVEQAVIDYADGSKTVEESIEINLEKEKKAKERIETINKNYEDKKNNINTESSSLVQFDTVLKYRPFSSIYLDEEGERLFIDIQGKIIEFTEDSDDDLFIDLLTAKYDKTRINMFDFLDMSIEYDQFDYEDASKIRKLLGILWVRTDVVTILTWRDIRLLRNRQKYLLYRFVDTTEKIFTALVFLLIAYVIFIKLGLLPILLTHIHSTIYSIAKENTKRESRRRRGPSDSHSN